MLARWRLLAAWGNLKNVAKQPVIYAPMGRKLDTYLRCRSPNHATNPL